MIIKIITIIFIRKEIRNGHLCGIIESVFTVIPRQSAIRATHGWPGGLSQFIPLKKHAPRVTDSGTASNQLML